MMALFSMTICTEHVLQTVLLQITAGNTAITFMACYHLRHSNIAIGNTAICSFCPAAPLLSVRHDGSSQHDQLHHSPTVLLPVSHFFLPCSTPFRPLA
jgi:hypothetical protein